MKQKILDATNGGLDIILAYYPQARETVNRPQKHFKIRDESTASTSLKQFGGVWYVTDFGDQSKGKNCFDIAMEIENLSFGKTLQLLANRYHISNETSLTPSINQPTIESRRATANDPEFTYKTHPLTEAERRVFGPFVTDDVLADYNYFALESYTHISEKGNFVTFIANDNYPIFMHDCGSFQKIYKPLEPDKQHRFRSFGVKTRDYVNGLDVVEKRFARLKNSIDEDAPQKLSEVIICSGERDAMNLAGMGFLPVWLNSETATISESLIQKLLTMAERVYNLPDIDDTGLKMARKMALEHLDVFTIELPSWLRNYRDHRGKPRKDLRDFVELRPNIYEFRRLMNTACQCKFWELKKNGQTCICVTSLLYYLQQNGFYKYKDPVNKATVFVKIEGYKVHAYEPQEVRDFIKRDLGERLVDNRIKDAFINSKRTSNTLTNDLNSIELDFKKSDAVSRTLFFANTAIRVFANKIDTIDTNRADQFAWNENVVPHTFKRLPEAFSYRIDRNGELRFELKKSESSLLKYLINTSRIYWQEELERRLDPDEKANEKYANEHRFTINSPRLTAKENDEQLQHLMNKLFAIGYQMHTFKSRSKAYALWVMENRLTSENESRGGSGKSQFASILRDLKLANLVQLDGRNKKLTDNNHFLERVSSKTDIMLIDDAHRHFDFNSFYSLITNNWTVNPKRDKSIEIAFEEAPKVTFTSNFPPPNDDSSTMRRILSVVFSDYYHFEKGDGTYKSSRSIHDDFGKDLFTHEYTEEEFNADFNVCVDCLQFYLAMSQAGKIIQPPMQNIMKRLNISKMGDLFLDWAETYFDPNGYHVNCLIRKQFVWREFLLETGASDKQWKILRFTQALKAYAAFSEKILNPAGIVGYDQNRDRIRRKRDNNYFEYIYMQTPNAELNQDCFYNEY